MFRLTYDYDPEEAYLKTLKWTNKIRAQYGADPLSELPPGRPNAGLDCPVANGVGNQCYVGRVRLTIHTCDTSEVAWKHIRIPGYVKMFIEYFDEGWYPDLIEKVPVVK